MAGFILPDILKTFLKLSSSCQEDSSYEGEPFPFFDLPEVVIDKILKEYVPVTDKAGALSEIPIFKQYLTRKSLWYPSSLHFFEQTRKIKPGWYVKSDDLRYVRYYAVDYFDLTVTVYYFYVNSKQTTVPVYRRQYQRRRRYTSLDLFRNYGYSNILTWINTLLVYECHSFSRPLHFWIFRPDNYVRWPQDMTLQDEDDSEAMGWPESIGVYTLVFNKCAILDENVHPHPILLTLKEDLSVILQCAKPKDAQQKVCKEIYTELVPLTFQLCKQKGHSRPDLIPMECATCERGEHFVHPTWRETFLDIKRKTAVTQETMYFTSLNQAVKYHVKLYEVYG